MDGTMADAVFKWRHFAPELIVLCVRWYCRYAISYRDLEEMMAERGVAVDHTTLYRWVQRHAPELEKRTLWHQNRLCHSWRVDETYVKVRGKWKYLFRAVEGRPHARLLLVRHPEREGGQALPGQGVEALGADCEHRQAKYLNNVIEADHGKLKRLIKPTPGFQSMRTAYATLKGFEVMRMFSKGRFDFWIGCVGGGTEATLINRLFGVHATAG